jgi:hypothetical protein
VAGERGGQTAEQRIQQQYLRDVRRHHDDGAVATIRLNAHLPRDSGGGERLLYDPVDASPHSGPGGVVAVGIAEALNVECDD